ncbi:MAG: DUF58 domain-containing protein [Gemmatimonadetes bacterium]|nr:DUF58 domain-containing protein [Gemmatimonadota bacterium]MEC8993764.1 DUF58 domain-containing protein [Candidatus Latescibacterota bacterium]MED5415012.1 DUF58 domain-containing protein [Candidatus Latescibacterota bacterium]MEE3042060.1 DUF58 domain-containing protein [Candidatus Latescibacterota bacterium]MEE3334881.1 DUF58 domain-containing protein [Candidatus Latescibacterota bacterium]
MSESQPNPPSLTDYLSPDFASSLGRLDLVARRVVEGFITGLHRSPYHGFSVEFSEHRPYMPGDSLRNLDWKALGKTDRLYVKQYEEETNLRAYLIVDISGSMSFGEDGRLTKFRYATCLAAALSLLMLRQRDAVGLALVDDRVTRFVRPRSVRSHLQTLLLELTKAEPNTKSQMAPAFHDLAERLSRRGLVILLSDMLDDPEQVLSGLRHFRHRGHEVVAMQILDPRERDLDFRRNDTRFVDLEDADADITTQPWHIQEAYQAQMEALVHRYSTGCAEAGIDYALFDTSTPFDHALSHYLVRRKRIG